MTRAFDNNSFMHGLDIHCLQHGQQGPIVMGGRLLYPQARVT